LGVKTIARLLGISRNTVRAAVASDGPPKYTRPARGSIVDAVEPQIREILAVYPAMPATVIAERIGWTRSIRVLSERVAQLRPAYLPPDPASRTAYTAGEIAQCDLWFPPATIPVGYGQVRQPNRLPVLTMVLGYSRWLCALLLPSRRAEDLFGGWWHLIAGVGAVPRVLVWDGEGAIGRWRAGRSELTGECQAFRGTLGTKVVICRPADPEAKGIIERAHDYLERSFLPGRQFSGPADFNGQLTGFLAVANTRPRRVLGCAPADRVGADRAAMLALPPVAPVTGWHAALRLPRDHYVRLDSNDYSVDPAVVGRRVEVRADLARVQVWCAGRLVADHERLWAWHQTVSDPEHVTAAAALRRHRAGLRLVGHDQRSSEVAVRALTDYDTALGLAPATSTGPAEDTARSDPPHPTLERAHPGLGEVDGGVTRWQR
jgi:transposase